jgi:hypothetical protein
VKCGWLKCSEDLSKRVSNIIGRYIDHMKFAGFLFITFFFILLVTFFIILYVFLSLCMFRSVYSV